MAATQRLPSNGEGNSEMLAALNARLAKRLKVERTPQPEPPASSEPREPQSVLDLIDTAIVNLPATEAEWSVIMRYSRNDVKERVAQARENLCTLRSLLVGE